MLALLSDSKDATYRNEVYVHHTAVSVCMSMHVSDVDNLVSSSPPSVLRAHRPTSVPSLTRVLQHDTIHEYSLIEREEGILERRLDGAARCRLSHEGEMEARDWRRPEQVHEI